VDSAGHLPFNIARNPKGPPRPGIDEGAGGNITNLGLRSFKPATGTVGVRKQRHSPVTCEWSESTDGICTNTTSCAAVLGPRPPMN
jgi:hypothetical protein